MKRGAEENKHHTYLKQYVCRSACKWYWNFRIKRNVLKPMSYLCCLLSQWLLYADSILNTIFLLQLTYVPLRLSQRVICLLIYVRMYVIYLLEKITIHYWLCIKKHKIKICLDFINRSHFIIFKEEEQLHVIIYRQLMLTVIQYYIHIYIQ